MSIVAAVNLFFKLGRTTAAKDAALKLLNRKRFTGELARKIKARSIKKGFMKESDELSKKTGLKVGERQRDYSDPDFIAKQKAGRLVKPSVNLTEYNLARQKAARTYGRDPTVWRGGHEGRIRAGVAGKKSSLGTALSSDVASVKGILSMLRAALLYNPGQEAKLLKSANLMKYNRQIQPYLKELDDVERQIRYWRRVGERSEGTPAFYRSRERDVQRLDELMEKYIGLQYKLKKAIDPSATLKSIQETWMPKKVTWSHPAALGANVEHALAKGPGYKFSEYLTKDPKALTRYDPDLGPLNIGRDYIDYGILEASRNPNIPVTRAGVEEISKLYKQAGMRSIMPSPSGGKMTLGEYDIGRQIDFLTKSLGQGKMPFHGLDTEKIIEILMRKSKLSKFGYQAGGLVGIGSKILARLAKKLSEKELKMLMGSLWKGVDPKKSGRYRTWDKQRWGPGYKWPWKKSRIRGPGIKKSHYASLSDEAKERLRERYAKRLAEYIARKKRGG